MKLQRECLTLFFLVSLLLSCILSTYIQAQERKIEIDPELRQEVETFMETMRKTFQSGDVSEVRKLFNHNQMVSQAERTGIIKFASPASRAAFTKGFESRIDDSMKMWCESFFWDKLQVQHIEHIDDRRVAVVVRQWSDESQVYSKDQWWLIKSTNGSGNRWQFYDLVDLDLNIRTSTMVALAASAAKNQEGWLVEMMELVSWLQTNGSVEQMLENVEDIEETLKSFTSENVPREIRSFGFTMLTLKYMSDENRLDDALTAIEEVGKIDPGSVVRLYLQGNVLSAMGEYDKAIETFTLYAEIYGWEADVCESVSDIYLELENKTKSIEFARKGLADNKDAWGCMLSLLVALPDDQKMQVDQHLANIDHNIEVLEIGIDYAIELDDLVSARHFYRLLQKHHPDSDLIDYYQEQFDQ